MSLAKGEDNLTTLLASLRPQLHPAVFVFCALKPDEPIPEGLSPICQFREVEGLTLIVEQEQAESFGLACNYPCRMVTLAVHSSLEAVGMLAAITQTLAAEGISVNAVSAYYHDHLFVECDQVEAALECLKKLGK